VALLLIIVAAVTVLALGAPNEQVAAIEAPEDVESTIALAFDEPAPAAATPDSTRPPISANDFIPDDRDLTSCIGVLERPGCGSENRGGWRQTLVFGAMFLGLVLVFGNVVRGVRKRKR
jgi:hypothetical protein